MGCMMSTPCWFICVGRREEGSRVGEEVGRDDWALLD